MDGERTVIAFTLAFAAAALAPGYAPGVEEGLRVTLRTRSEAYRGSGEWLAHTFRETLRPSETAVVLCDLWDRHWCASATRRCGVIAKRVNRVVEALRSRGILVIHAPSETMEFYEGTPARNRARSAPEAALPASREFAEPPLPVDDSDGGCDDEPQCRAFQAWKRQDPSIRVDEARDAVTDNGREVYNLLRSRGIRRLLVMGVHTNMCVLGRSFAIRQMTRWGIGCILVRDLTDTMYNPRKAPHLPHEKGTELVIEHIEKHWCPTVLSRDLLRS